MGSLYYKKLVLLFTGKLELWAEVMLVSLYFSPNLVIFQDALAGNHEAYPACVFTVRI